MSLDMTQTLRQGEAVLTLSGEADGESAPGILRAVDALAGESLRRLVFDLSALTYLSSAGLRCLVFAHQKLGRGVEIVLADPSPEVTETIRLAGFDRSATITRGAPR
jgi:anti-sigma B factor antagonist